MLYVLVFAEVEVDIHSSLFLSWSTRECDVMKTYHWSDVIVMTGGRTERRESDHLDLITRSSHVLVQVCATYELVPLK